jgi:hypothetical protein
MASRCGVRDPNLLFAAAILHDQAGVPGAADDLVEELEALDMPAALRAAFDSWKVHRKPLDELRFQF